MEIAASLRRGHSPLIILSELPGGHRRVVYVCEVLTPTGERWFLRFVNRPEVVRLALDLALQSNDISMNRVLRRDKR